MRHALIASLVPSFILVSLACSGGTSTPDVSLSGGFLPDPHTTTVTVTGSVQASDALLPSSCVGYMDPNTPSYTVALSDMSTAVIAACSSEDTALAIKTPGGSWLCDDDSEDNNPKVTINNPSGNYEIYVARYSDSSIPTATLNISESDGSFCGGGSGSQTINMTGTPSGGTTSVASGFGSQTASITAGGSTDADNVSEVPSSCTGYIDGSAPTYRISVAEGLGHLRIGACAEADTTLIVNDGDGNWHCNDDGTDRNPDLAINSPTSGTWDVWVGTYSSGSGSPATLKLADNPNGSLCN